MSHTNQHADNDATLADLTARFALATESNDWDVRFDDVDGDIDLVKEEEKQTIENNRAN